MTRRFPAGQTRKLAVEITRPIHRVLRIHLIHTDRTMIELMDAAGHRYLDWLDSGGISDRRLFAIHPIRISVGILLPMHRRLTTAALPPPQNICRRADARRRRALLRPGRPRPRLEPARPAPSPNYQRHPWRPR